MNPISGIRHIAIPDPQSAYSALLPRAGRDASAISPISPAQIEELPGAFATPSAEPPPGFGQLLGQMVSEVSGKQAAAGDAVSGLLAGQNVPLHRAMIAMEEASVSFQLMVEVRNKLLESYQELMRMQI